MGEGKYTVVFLPGMGTFSNQLELLYQKYNENLHTLTFLSDESIKEMKKYKEEGDFLKD